MSLSRPVADARSISELIDDAIRGKLRIPPFQRRLRWYGTDIERLFDSIRRNYPVGSLLLWERRAPAATVVFGSLSVSAPEMENAWWVVDGQQRLTSLVGVLASPPDPSPEFDLYYDLSTSRFRRPGSRRAQQDWMPLRHLVDTNDFLTWLLEYREHGATAEQVQAATELGNQLRDYKIPISLVRDAEESELRDIFDRMNNYGRSLTRAEVFHALHAASDGTQPADLRALVAEVGDIGFGSLQEDTVLRAVLAMRGGDPYRDFHNEFEGEDPARTFTQASEALRRTIEFLQRDARIPHLRALPSVHVIAVLARLFALHPEPSARTRVLLRRWIWRDAAVGGGSGGGSVLRRAVRAIDDEESTSVQQLLKLSPATPIRPLDLTSHQLNRAASRINLALLNQLHPLDLRTGEPVDVPALLDGGEGLRIPWAGGHVNSIANVFLHASLRDDEVDDVLTAASTDALASHGLPSSAAGLLASETMDAVLSARAEILAQALPECLNALTEPEMSDRPALSTLAVADPAS